MTSGDKLTTTDLIGLVGPNCVDCPKARLLGNAVAKAAQPEITNAAAASANYAGYIALCSREAPIKSANDDSCLVVNEQRRCLHGELNAMGFEDMEAKAKQLTAEPVA